MSTGPRKPKEVTFVSHPVSAPLPAALPARIPVREILPLAALVTLLALITLYFVSAEDGVTA
ncbi:MAG: hypothetical protein ACRDQB_07000, partial [Thermocrispum sp.]